MTEPTFTLAESASHLGMTEAELQAFIDQELPAMLAEGVAHYDDAGNLIIDGGGDG